MRWCVCVYVCLVSVFMYTYLYVQLQAGAQHRETPRMLLLQQHHHHGPNDEDDDAALARYVTSESSPALLRWWAAHCEASGRFVEAKDAYRRAGAWAEAVRLACYEGVGASVFVDVCVYTSSGSLTYIRNKL